MCRKISTKALNHERKSRNTCIDEVNSQRTITSLPIPLPLFGCRKQNPRSQKNSGKTSSRDRKEESTRKTRSHVLSTDKTRLGDVTE